MEQAWVAGLIAGASVLSFTYWFVQRYGSPRAMVHRRVQTFLKGGAPAPAAARATPEPGGGGRRTATRGAEAEGRNRYLRAVDRAIESAQTELTAREVLIAAGSLAAVGFALIWFLFSPAIALFGALVGAYLPFLWLRRRAGGIQKRFQRQMPDTVSLLASAVRAGNALPRAFERVAQEAPEPTRSAFRTSVREMGLGAPLEQALERLSQRYPSQDMELLVASISVQYQVGGNLTKVLDLIAETLRERQRILGDINSLTATQRYSAYLLSALPVFVGIMLYFISKEYISQLFEGVFRLLLGVAATLVVVGFLAMQQLAKVDV